MIIIYDQDKTYFYNSLGDAEETIIALYGAKLGREACTALRNGRTGLTKTERSISSVKLFMQKPKIERWISSVKPVFLKKFENKK